MAMPPFKVKAVFEYTSAHEDDLHFPNGQIITVTEEEDDDWYAGEYVDASGVKQEGIFPRNFVEKYEPIAPARPTRTNRPKKESEAAPVPSPATVLASEQKDEPEVERGDTEPEVEVHSPPIARQLSPQPEVLKYPPPSKPLEVSAPSASKPAPPPAASKAPGPPPITEKPTGNSFRDRIAAFNKAAPPPAPFKPGGLSSGGSKRICSAPREPPPQKLYKRDEDPEIAARETENLEQAEKAGLAPPSSDANAEEQPKTLTLKERMALLQKQQAEQASRHAELAARKEKPKRPAKKRTESHGPSETAEEEDGPRLERRDTAETIGKSSIEVGREEQPRRRKSSRGAPNTPGLNPQRSFGDGNEADMSGAGDTTEEPEEASTSRDDSDEKSKVRAPHIPIRAPNAPVQEPDVGEKGGASEEEEGDAEEEEDEEDDIDPEVRRKEELRARMAKMSGGMGMYGMFGAQMPGLPPPKKKSTGTSESRPPVEHGSEDAIPGSTRAPPVPMPGLSRVRSPEEIPRQLDEDDDQTPIARTRPAEEVPDVEDVIPEKSPPSLPIREGAPPPIPGGRPAPPPIPLETRPAPPPPAAANPTSPSTGSESDDELSEQPQDRSLDTPVAGHPRSQITQEIQNSPKRASYFGDEPSPSSPVTPGINKDRRTSKVPPIPGAAQSSAPQSRAPPPPPPGQISRTSTGDQRAVPSKSAPQDLSDDEEVTEYEGDYDTDIASAVPHKDALKAHTKEPTSEDAGPGRSPLMAPSAPPPLPSVSAPRAVPPPVPSQPPPPSRKSVDMPRAAPPPPPPGKLPAPWEQDDDDEYDPYRYNASQPTPRPAPPPVAAPSPKLERRESDLYSASPPRSYASPAQNREPPPPPPRDDPPPSANRAPPRQSLDVTRAATAARRSTELGRMSMDSGYVANEIDLARNSFWWTQPRGIPPVLLGRRDILLEFEESTAPGRNGKTTITKELYVLFLDYSQTIITAEFDAQNPGDVKLEQRHDQPPSRPRQDVLEEAHEQFGREIIKAVASKKETIVGDGTPQGLVQELLKPFADHVLLPIGTRSYGAIVYGNLANASTQSNDEIRPGDIITLRNTKFQGKHGPMHAKYSVEIGKPDHVGVVAEWDGTKKKVRAWEQGRESKKVKLESFKLEDLRSGEVKIWRVMPRSWVGWRR
ncbi:hypothetical protein B0O99DRAFT_593853 [Bisporella sp. PMI_857]|nr:hypothetical protein B0O99DRAFT_593853 [Bisporella sp. PMI_857]